ncbi:MAG: hypothetical protein OXT67_02800 [Zetaproteobacteria bacterium]|nr:hypothetical protein [Zetaproteobacteria bacterium]
MNSKPLDKCLQSSTGQLGGEDSVLDAVEIDEGSGLRLAPSPVLANEFAVTKVVVTEESLGGARAVLNVDVAVNRTPEVYLWRVCDQKKPTACFPTQDIARSGWAFEYFKNFYVFGSSNLSGRGVLVSVRACVEKDTALEFTHPELNWGTQGLTQIGPYVCTAAESASRKLPAMPQDTVSQNLLDHLRSELKIRQQEIPEVVARMRRYAGAVVGKLPDNFALSKVPQASGSDLLVGSLKNIARMRYTDANFFATYRLSEAVEVSEEATTAPSSPGDDRANGLRLAGAQDGESTDEDCLPVAGDRVGDGDEGGLADSGDALLDSLGAGIDVEGLLGGGNEVSAVGNVPESGTTTGQVSASEADPQAEEPLEQAEDEDAASEDFDDSVFDDYAESGKASSKKLQAFFIVVGFVAMGVTAYANVKSPTLFGVKSLRNPGRVLMDKYETVQEELLREYREGTLDGTKVEAFGQESPKNLAASNKALDAELIRYNARLRANQNPDLRRIEIASLDQRMALLQSGQVKSDKPGLLADMQELRQAYLEGTEDDVVRKNAQAGQIKQSLEAQSKELKTLSETALQDTPEVPSGAKGRVAGVLDRFQLKYQSPALEYQHRLLTDANLSAELGAKPDGRLGSKLGKIGGFAAAGVAFIIAARLGSSGEGTSRGVGLVGEQQQRSQGIRSLEVQMTKFSYQLLNAYNRRQELLRQIYGVVDPG